MGSFGGQLVADHIVKVGTQNLKHVFIFKYVMKGWCLKRGTNHKIYIHFLEKPPLVFVSGCFGLVCWWLFFFTCFTYYSIMSVF